ncbi:CIA30 family protein [Ferrimonas kyonanensis]|uniref:CIA30 family protein n=1 Tax=Ferrimonas kyonanensis TaxID=364763 RepID=UPI000A02BD70|nr:CIA30 family protein [Ferrimonas kyonanensis]
MKQTPSEDRQGISMPLWSDDVSPWQALNDGVMGGQSKSGISRAGNQLCFRGSISLAGGGGFASVRRPFRLPAESAQLHLRVLGDGRRYQLRLKMDSEFDGVIYVAEWIPPAGRWSEARFTQAAFEPKFRGRALNGQLPLQFKRVRQLGLLTGERQPGPFCLWLDSELSVHSSAFSGSDVLDRDPED